MIAAMPPILPPPHRAKPAPVRVQYPGQGLASWFQDAGATACGFHATLGFANKALPCGAKVTFWHAGRSVTGTREDSGPYVFGRSFDLSPSLRAALACPDLCVVRFRMGGPPPLPPTLWRVTRDVGMKGMR